MSWEVVLFAACVGLTFLVPLLVARSSRRSSAGARPISHRSLLWSSLGILAGTLTVVGSAMFLFSSKHGELSEAARPQAAELVPPRSKDNGYVSSDACRACHPQQYDSWHDTYHRTMTQIASPETVVAPFDGIRLAAHGDWATLARRGDEFWLRVFEADENRAQRPMTSKLDPTADTGVTEVQVVMTTGSHNFQVYWIPTSRGRELLQFPWRYHIHTNQWIHRRDVFLQPPGALSATGRPVWNSTCINCHSVAGQPGHNYYNGVMDSTRVAELGISCEACHGPGEEHVRANRDPRRRYELHLGDKADPTIINPSRIDPRLLLKSAADATPITWRKAGRSSVR